jgi:SAM-dependent methyltransferase
MPDDGELARAYDPAFHDTPQQAVPVMGSSFSRARARGWPIYQNAVDRVRFLQRLKPGGDLLDVGCGKGVFVRVALPPYNGLGIDVAPHAVTAARALGAEAVCGNLCDIDWGRRRFDLLTFWDSLACMPDPVAVMQRASSLLKPDGFIVATVPDAEAHLSRWLGRRWPLAIPPINVALYTKRSLQALGERCGLRIHRHGHWGKWVDVGMACRKGWRMLSGGRAGSGDIPPKRPLAVPVDLGDIATVVYSKS